MQADGGLEEYLAHQTRAIFGGARRGVLFGSHRYGRDRSGGRRQEPIIAVDELPPQRSGRVAGSDQPERACGGPHAPVPLVTSTRRSVRPERREPTATDDGRSLGPSVSTATSGKPPGPPSPGSSSPSQSAGCRTPPPGRASPRRRCERTEPGPRARAGSGP